MRSHCSASSGGSPHSQLIESHSQLIESFLSPSPSPEVSAGGARMWCHAWGFPRRRAMRSAFESLTAFSVGIIPLINPGSAVRTDLLYRPDRFLLLGIWSNGRRPTRVRRSAAPPPPPPPPPPPLPSLVAPHPRPPPRYYLTCRQCTSYAPRVSMLKPSSIFPRSYEPLAPPSSSPSTMPPP